MKAWAQKRREEMEAVGERELAHIFQLVEKICDLEGRLGSSKTNFRKPEGGTATTTQYMQADGPTADTRNHCFGPA